MGFFDTLFGGKKPQPQEEKAVQPTPPHEKKEPAMTQPYETSNGYMLQQDAQGSFITNTERDELELNHDLGIMEFDEYFDELLELVPPCGVELERDEEGGYKCRTERERLAVNFVGGNLSREDYMDALQEWEREIYQLQADRHQGAVSEAEYQERRNILGTP